MMEWYWYSLAGAITSTVYFSLLKATLLKGNSPIVILSAVFSISAPIIYSYGKVKGLSFQIADIKEVLILGILASIQLICVYTGFERAPNPGMNSAIVVSYVVGITLFSHFAFGCPLTSRQLVGILSVILGICLITIK